MSRQEARQPAVEHHTAADRGDDQPAPEIRAVEREPKIDLQPVKHAASSAMEAAVDAAGERVVGWWQPLPDQPSYTELLDPQRTFSHSLSLGTVGTGQLVNAARIPHDGEHYSVIERHRARNTQYGSEALIDAIVDSAKSVAERFPGSTLRVGNLSRKGGGDIPWSSSHNSGRDADLAFYVKRKEDGERVPAPGLLSFDADGQATGRPDLVFDTERNWQLARALLTHEQVNIQWLFVSNGLKHLMLEHARRIGEDEQLLARAEKVLHQPTDAAPHNDHFHLRITCPPADRLEGCLDFGPRWDWVDWHYEKLLARSVELGRALREDDEEMRVRALDFLERIRSPFAPELALAAALEEDSEKVRRRALKVAADVPYWSGAAVGAALRFVERDEFSLDEKAYAYRVLRKSADSLAVEPLERRLVDERVGEDERVHVARALVHLMEPELVPFLMEQLAEQPAAVRAQLAVTLRRVTNHSEGLDWSEASAEQRQETLTRWQNWWEERRDRSRDQWLEEGFAANGCDEDDIFAAAAAGELIPMLRSDQDHVAYNANRLLSRITGRWSPLEAWSNARLHKYWSKWWKRNHQDMLVSR
ncbi:MAG: penicillin-insensitive murein endopeptidase [Persicimonas sp.]